MKLRIKGNSIRFRLTKSEVENFAAYGKIEENVGFSSANFLYSLEKSSAKQITASFKNGKITVFVPNESADQWAHSEEVGLDGNDGGLRISIEKDFACLNPRRDEDENDNFPHPNQDRSC